MQEGVLGLLKGYHMNIKPEGFDALHMRGGEPHRLRMDAQKWKALGIGSEEADAKNSDAKP